MSVTETNTLSNPFSTRFWTPGTLAFEFDDAPDETVGVDRLLNGWLDDAPTSSRVVQVVGPHGSGKTTLLEALERRLKSRGLECHRAVLNDDRRRLPVDFRPTNPGGSKAVFLLDGYEQLSIPDRVRLRLQPWNRVAGLLWTTHRPAWGVPVLCRTRSSFERFQEMVERLLLGRPIAFKEELLRDVFVRADGNFRSAFFELYDRFAETEND